MVRACALILGLCLSAGIAAAADRVDEHVRAQLAARKLPGAAVAVVKGGRIVKSAGYRGGQPRAERAESLRIMSEPVRLRDGRTVSRGLGWFVDTFNGHRFGAHWGTTVTGHSAVIRRYVDAGVTVIVMANLNDDGQAVDAMSKRIADIYVAGVEIHGLRPAFDRQVPESARIRKILESVAAGADHEQAPGLAARLPPPVRDRIGRVVRTATAFEFLGEESLGPSHFNLDPSVVSVRRYRAITPEGSRYLTVRLTRSGAVTAALIED